jgi:hypothetical protein
MKKKNSKDYQDIIRESGIDLDKIPLTPKKIQKSTRTTFNLKKKTHEIFSSLCSNYGMKQKELIDDGVVPNALSIVAAPEFQKFISKGQDSDQSDNYERKTFVLSKESLKKLNETSKNTGVHRDRLFTIGVSVQKFVLDERNKKHRQAFEILEELSHHINSIEKKCEKLLGDDDPIPQRIGIVAIILDNLLMAIEAELNRGVPIDGYDFSQQG